MVEQPHPLNLNLLPENLALWGIVYSDLVDLGGVTFGGNNYDFVILEGRSRYSYVYFTSSKDADSILLIVQWHMRFVNSNIRKWHTDSGEFHNEKIISYCQSVGTQPRFSTPGVKQQNGGVERRIRQLRELSIAVRAAAGVLDDLRFAAEAWAAVNYLINRTPSFALKGLTPYEIMHQKKPNLSHLRPWGCMVYVLVPSETRGKNDSKPRPEMLVGYVDDSTKVYKTWINIQCGWLTTRMFRSTRLRFRVP